MGHPGFEKSNDSTKITAAHLAGIRPRPLPKSPFSKWDLSTAFVAGLAVSLLTLPEFASVLDFANVPGVPHSTTNLSILLGVIGFFGIFPIVFLQYLFLQNIRAQPNRLLRVASAAVSLSLIYVATGAMKPLVGYHQKLAENRAYHSRVVGVASRSPASIPVELSGDSLRTTE